MQFFAIQPGIYHILVTLQVGFRNYKANFQILSLHSQHQRAQSWQRTSAAKKMVL